MPGFFVGLVSLKGIDKLGARFFGQDGHRIVEVV